MRKLTSLLKRVVARESYHPLLTYPWFLVKVLVCRIRYANTVTRLRDKVAQGKKIKVIFLSMDTAKWKCQSIYDEMKKSGMYEPVVALTMTEEDEKHTASDIDKRNLESRIYYEKHGCDVILACDSESRKVTPLNELGADIVFFQVPWGNLPGQTVWECSKYALTCNMPYSIEFVEWNNHRRRFDFNHMGDFHSLMWANFYWSEAYARDMRLGHFPWEWAGRRFGTGHTTLDVYTTKREENKMPGDSIIYAPHFSFTWREHAPIMNISTFHWSGVPILEYAKAHPELKWAFKPHPKLRERLSEIGFMTKQEVDEYYAQWEELGASCYDGDYADMFFASRAMVTDSSSFLFEYMPVGKPLIRLIPEDIKVTYARAAVEVGESFYNCKSLEEMYAAFDCVLIEQRDPKKSARYEACQKAKLLGNYAAGNVMAILKKELSV